MPKLNFSALRQEAAIADTARQSAAANRKRLIDNVYAYAYETSWEGILTLLRLAHLSMVSEGVPSEVPTQNEFQSTGREPVLRMDNKGNWSASLSKDYDGPEQRPTGRWLRQGRSNWVALEDAIAAAADMPSAADVRKAIWDALDPIKDRDFDHFGVVLDRIPLRTLSAMLGVGSKLASALGLGLTNSGTTYMVDGEWYPDVEYTDDVGKLALCIGDAMMRRMAPVTDHGMELFHMIAEARRATKNPLALSGLQVPRPTCMTIVAPHTPLQTIKDFLHQAVRVGFDLNAVYGLGGVPTAAHKAVTLLPLKDLDASVAMGLDLEFADDLSSLTEVVIDQLCRRSSKKALPMLKHLVNKYGLAVEQESYLRVAEALGEAYREDRDAWHDECKDTKQERQKRIQLLKATGDFLDEKFPRLHKKNRKAA
jgi:hypothetical protein